MKEDILSYQVDRLSINDCVNEVFESLHRKQGKGWLACLNPHSYVVALDDADFALALKSSDWLVPDGVGVVYASRLLGGAVKMRVTGSDVFQDLHARMNTCTDMSVFFLGSSDDTLTTICTRMSKDFPNVHVAGTYSPPFKTVSSDAELNEMTRAINNASPDVLWVGMTAPKQEKWIFDNLHLLDVKFAGAVGAVFDFYAGKVKRSHPVFQQLGLEWLPRLFQQPQRLWRRMFVSAPIFAWHVFKQFVRQHL